jgi:hypothetical protein
MKQRSQKDQVHPLALPWMTSTSVSDLHVSVVENGDATVRCDVAAISDQDPFGELAIRRANVSFRGGQWLRIEPAASDAATVPPDRFDWNGLPFRGVKDQNFDGFLREFRTSWIETGNCPDPKVYEIMSSTWLSSSGAIRFGCKHYLIVGRDLWLEILSLDFKWRYD